MCFTRLPTDAAGYGAVPLGQSVGDCQTFNGARSLQNVARAAFKADHVADGEVVSHAAAVSGLGNRAALGGAGLWDRFREKERSTREITHPSAIFEEIPHRVAGKLFSSSRHIFCEQHLIN